MNKVHPHTVSALLRACCLWLLGAMLLWGAGTSAALAALTINSVTVNGNASDTVAPGVNVAVVVNTTIATTGNRARWRSTQFSTNPSSGLAVCRDEPNYNDDGNYSQSFTLAAPSGTNVYALVVSVWENPNCNGESATRSFPAAIITDTVAPVVQSIVRAAPSPTNASTVSWTVTFSKPVTGVSLNDFVLVNGGLGGTLTLSQTGSDSGYTLTATTGTGSGTLGLNLIDDDSIIGTNNVRLGGTGVGNGNFTGQVYTIDRTPPTIPTATISANNVMSPLFAKVGDTVSVAFTTADTNGGPAPVATIGGVAATVTGSGNNWVASRVMTTADAEGLVPFALNVTDLLGNAATTRTTVSDTSSVTFDNTPPTASISCANPVSCGAANPTAVTQFTWNVGFSEAVTGVGANNFTLSFTGGTSGAISSAGGSGSAYSISANASGGGTVGLNLSQNLANVRDRAGNTPSATVAVPGNTYTIAGCVTDCTFDAVEPGTVPRSPIFTKRVGASVVLDLVALNGAVLHATSTATITARLVVASNTPACGTVPVSNAVTMTYSAADAGRRTVSFTPSRAARDVRVIIESDGKVSCSTDNFAVRPDGISMSTANANANLTASGSSVATANPAFKAGSDVFELRAASAIGYDGTPLLNQSWVQAASGAKGALAGVFAAALAATGTAAGTAFTYSEVGYFRLQNWGVYDDGSFAAVDRSKSPTECFSDAGLGGAGVPADPNIASGGKLGCYFGSAQSDYYGRFIPHHFALTLVPPLVNRSDLTTCAAAEFTYFGEAMKPSFILKAQNATNDTTVNYTGDYAHLNIATQLGLEAVDVPASGARTPFPVCPATPTSRCIIPGAATGSFSNGVSTLIYTPLTVSRPGSAAGPFADFKVGIAPIDIDGVRLASYNLDTSNAGSNNHAEVGATKLLYGRMSIDNTYGSELLRLTINIKAQHWKTAVLPAVSGYVVNALDNCTPLTTFALDSYLGGINSTNMPLAKLNPGGLLINGAGSISLSRPGLPVPTQKGSVMVRSGLPYLPGAGRATFGVYKSGPVIYVRETY